MKFYDREEELEILRDTALKSKEQAQFTVLTGRRRIGKTTLMLRAFEQETMLYFFVARKAEQDLCIDFATEMEQKLGMPIVGTPKSFASLFEALMKVAENRPFTLVIDEFQEFLRVNPAIFSEIQRVWDLYKGRSRINLVASGSIYRLMTQIFSNRNEPLYSRQTRMLTVMPFTTSVLKQILKDYKPNYMPEDLLTLYALTGGVAKYVETLMDAGATSPKQMIAEVVRKDSIFLNEGKFLLLEEFGKDYNTYFSILSAIASGNTSRAEIEDLIGKEIGGYLTNLENDYGLIAKKLPMFQASTNKNVKYQVIDMFLSFWFRFLYKYNYILEIQAYEQLRKIIERDLSTFQGIALEHYFRAKLMEGQQCTRIGGWWDRRTENEIDIIAANDLDRWANFYEVKRNPSRYDEGALLSKIDIFLKSTRQFQGYRLSHDCLSLPDM
ncbi:MAG: ATP-binding protein [Bacteroidales bacterium]|nr:ATP-binding protein [Bacteroidales bacterium]